MSFSFRIPKWLILLVAVIVLLALVSDAWAAGGTKYTCNKALCKAYNADGTARMTKLMGTDVEVRVMVCKGTKIIGTKSGDWIKTGFENTDTYYRAKDFK